MIKKLLKLIFVMLPVSLLFTSYAWAAPPSEFFGLRSLQPQLSSDGNTLYNAGPPVVYMLDPNPSAQQVRIPARLYMQALPEAATATFSVSYIASGSQDLWGKTCTTFPEEAKAAFSAAGAIWSNILQSSVPITIRTCWSNLGSTSTLGYSGGQPTSRNFPGAPLTNTWYHGALANALAGYDLEPTEFDMHITYNSGFAWYYGTDGNTPSDKSDLMSVVLHEIAHGLGFAGSMRYSGGYAMWGDEGSPYIYDTFMKDGNGVQLINTAAYVNPSTGLGSAVTSNNIWFQGSNAMAANGGQRVKMYAPTTWSSGSSYSHLDYSTFRGTVNALMVYAILRGSSHHDPGPVTTGIFRDIGWPTQGACTYTLYPTSKAFSDALKNTGTITVTPSSTNCSWTATTSNSWITITSGSSGTGTGTVNYEVDANQGAQRNGTISIAGQTFNVTQPAGSVICTYYISPTSASISAGGGSGTISVTTQIGCAISANTSYSWITILSTANGQVSYSVAANTGTQRTGTINVAGQAFTIIQAAGLNCTYSISPTSASISAGGGAGTISVTTQTGCTWTTSIIDSWITVLSSGNGQVNYSVAANSGAQRTGAIYVAGKTFTIIQDASIGIGQAVDSTNLIWTTTGNSNWYGQAVVSYYGGSAAQSGAIGNNQSTSVQTAASGPANASFYWKVSSEANYDFLRFYIDGTLQSSISGNVDWQRKSYTLSSGNHTLRWEYSKDVIMATGSDAGWIDKVVVQELIFNTLTLNKAGTGSGTVTSSPSGINCGSVCSASYLSETTVTLSATASSGSSFIGWSGGNCSGTGSCTVVMDSSLTVTAVFNTLGPYNLSVSKIGTGTGMVTSASSGISCGTTCSASFSAGTSVTLTATTDSGSSFVGWSGGGCSGTQSCLVEMDSIHAVSATFNSSAENVYQILKWGSSGSGNGQFSRPYGVAVDSAGDVYVADSGNNRIQKFSSTGSFITKWGSSGYGDGQFSSPCGIAVDAFGNVYVTDTGSNRIQKFSSTGSFLAKWGSFGTGNGQFKSPYSVAVDPSRNVYVADTGNNRIQKFSSAGSFLAKWGSAGQGDGQFSSPYSLAISVGDVAVVDTVNNCIQKFSYAGSFLVKWGGQLSSPRGSALDTSENIYVADTFNNRIQQFSSAGSSIAMYGSNGSGDGQFSTPYGVAVDSSRNIYVADTGNDRIQKLAPVSCAYTLSKNAYGYTSPSVAVNLQITPSSSVCNWTATSNDSWISIISGRSGTGNGTLGISVSTNNTGDGRSGTLTIGGKTFTIHQAKTSFTDDPNNVFTPYINAIYAKGITMGCGNNSYCPANSVTRGEMSAFIIRSLYGEYFSYTAIPYFTDVSSDSVFFKYIQRMKDVGITASVGIYGVNDKVTREQMAAFIIRSIYGENFIYTSTPYFTDVSSASVFYKYIQKMKDSGITAATGTYTPTTEVTREQMSAFLGRAYLGME